MNWRLTVVDGLRAAKGVNQPFWSHLQDAFWSFELPVSPSFAGGHTICHGDKRDTIRPHMVPNPPGRPSADTPIFRNNNSRQKRRRRPAIFLARTDPENRAPKAREKILRQPFSLHLRMNTGALILVR
mmetsp:Transcript_64009/g.105693  ORF Transcript_64009/g.105693 Transcript_64009/m.105693 type:complete len:128 (+) Transcript_64009:656-1039(+)